MLYGFGYRGVEPTSRGMGDHEYGMTGGTRLRLGSQSWQLRVGYYNVVFRQSHTRAKHVQANRRALNRRPMAHSLHFA